MDKYGKHLEQAHQAYLVNKTLRNFMDEKQVYITGYIDALEKQDAIVKTLQDQVEVFKQALLMECENKFENINDLVTYIEKGKP